MSEKERIREVKESVFLLNNLYTYYQSRIDPNWIKLQRGKRDAAIRQANEQFAKSETIVAEAKAKIESTGRDLRVAEKELKKLTNDKKVEKLQKLARQIAALQRAIQELDD